MTKGKWVDSSKRSEAARKGAARRKYKPRGPYGARKQPEAVKQRLREIAARCGAAPPIDDRLPTPGELAQRIDAVLEAVEHEK
ncbi:hypothetical protein [Sphingomonas trueperi]|uniref:Uncharacterized protein n=1 Tax=Sphingomonas trueperi TaxID=53317 RepID=A0A7X6BFF1_9SPHN|nr:hypothetical protein [Sphingomonas trueperi]NJB99886.1 hypothetical protein [Sphingomonas trueperi]